MADILSSNNAFSGWRGGIGIASGFPATKIPDITELGYEIVWGDEDPAFAEALDIAVFRYWNSIVETSLRDRQGRYDFSRMEDKDEAARLAFDAWAELAYGVKGLSRYAAVRYHPEGSYGDVSGTMDLSSEHPLVTAVIANYLKRFSDDDIQRGGIALDNAGKVPQPFLAALKEKFNSKGLGIATNGCPDNYLPYIDFFGNEGFPFTVRYAHDIRARGFQGILGEFTMQHLSPGEMESYLKTKLFNGIVFFGYTNGSTAAGAHYSRYADRPDVYHHHRWILRKYIPLSRATCKAGLQAEPYARIKSDSETQKTPGGSPGIGSVKTTATGKVREYEWNKKVNIKEMFEDSISTIFISRFGNDMADGIYLYLNSAKGENVVCDVKRLNIDNTTLVFDEFHEEVLESKLTEASLEFTTHAAPTLIQLGSKERLVKNVLARIENMFREQIMQRQIDGKTGIRYPLKPWAPFCQGYTLDRNTSRSGKASLTMLGGTDTYYEKWKYHNRQGAAQLVVLNQKKSSRLSLTAYSKSKDVLRSDLTAITDRAHHFNCREGCFYCMHLYLDYQDGQWPQVHTVSFSPGSHDWEKKTINILPGKPVKTAMVLLEFHQPEGATWFDDVFLAQETEPEKNLLAYAGFEDDAPAPAKLKTLNADYNREMTFILSALKKTIQHEAVGRKHLFAIREQIEVLEKWIAKVEMRRFWTRELRDCVYAKEKLALSLKIMKA